MWEINSQLWGEKNNYKKFKIVKNFKVSFKKLQIASLLLPLQKKNKKKICG